MNKLVEIYWVLKNKITNKIWGVVNVPVLNKKKGDVLISYITAPFTLFPWEKKTDPHSNYWECRKIARLFSIRGYSVDCINAGEHRFIPHKNYIVCVDIQQDLERLSKYLPASCKKVIHIDNPYSIYYNKQESERLKKLQERRGAILNPKRQIKLSQSVARADFLEGFGNKTVHNSYREFGKPIFPIPISVSEKFNFPENKNFEKARKHFLYFGGGGAVLKGLDLAVEAFARLPDLYLHIVGPAPFESDFTKEYEKELKLQNIICYGRPKINDNGHINIGGKPFMEVMNMCAAVIYPSAAEGTSGAVIQAIHAGLIPIVTPETGIDPQIGGIILHNPTVESVMKTVKDFSKMPGSMLKKYAHDAWSYVNQHHTKETFSNAYAKFIDNILKL
ncbi:MAG: glycosyltransferase [Patescibacteria group bacterium]